MIEPSQELHNNTFSAPGYEQTKKSDQETPIPR